MIIRLTVNDNDFTQEIEKFADDLFMKMLEIDCAEDASLTEKLNAHKRWEEVFRLLNPNITTQLSKEDKIFLKAVLVLKWHKFVDTLPKSDHTKKYLKDNFNVRVSFQFKDQWENGEVLYYFTTAQKWLTQ